jgi:hypothetical protein
MQLGAISFHFLFWIVVFLIDLGPEWRAYSSVREALEVVGLTLSLQMVVALLALRFLVPRWLDQGAVIRFLGIFLLTLIAAAQINILVSYLYLENAYPESYGAFYQRYLADTGLLQRLGFSYLSKYIVLSKLPHLALPAAVLIAVDYYRRQQAVLALREQQRASELDALKSQLNPHFIFNTLNNIYALALKRSELTAEAVARLSNILDYVLHRGSQKLVSLRDEVEMIESYIALEQLRFGDRLLVSLTNSASLELKVPPLLFLTLLENAFKHGAAKSRHQEHVDITLTSENGELCFTVRNSVARVAAGAEKGAGDNAIGLRNLRRQLALQCPDSHQLSITHTDELHIAELTLKQSCQNSIPASSLTMRRQAAI